MPTLHATVRGVVQGVGFRHFVRRTARALDLAGHAVNLPDGSVRVEATGARAGLETLLTALRAGPVGSRVERVVHVFDEAGGAGGAAAGADFDIG